MTRISSRQLLITFVPSVSVLFVVVIVSVFFKVDMPKMTRDVTAIANIHPFSGALSNLGILLWCVSASICFFAAIIIRKTEVSNMFNFLFFSSLLSAYLLLDDLFLIHEELAFRYFGLYEEFIYVSFGVALTAYLVAYRSFIKLQTNYGTLLLAIGFLSLSIIIDTVLESWEKRFGYWMFFFEDGIKWLGIASWCSYYVHTSHRLLVGNVNIMPSTGRLVPRTALDPLFPLSSSSFGSKRKNAPN